MPPSLPPTSQLKFGSFEPASAPAKIGVSRSAPTYRVAIIPVKDLGKGPKPGTLAAANVMLPAVSLSAYLASAKQQEDKLGQLGAEQLEPNRKAAAQTQLQQVEIGIVHQVEGHLAGDIHDHAGLSFRSVGPVLEKTLGVAASSDALRPEASSAQVQGGAVDGVSEPEEAVQLMGVQAHAAPAQRSSSSGV
ncbi:hypothetical protein D1007_36773 [Hordeum vulgare]|nr:hypothetical protein D1007_36773 [Hordeum vulgare]